jgi:hypothetical protein
MHVDIHKQNFLTKTITQHSWLSRLKKRFKTANQTKTTTQHSRRFKTTNHILGSLSFKRLEKVQVHTSGSLGSHLSSVSSWSDTWFSISLTRAQLVHGALQVPHSSRGSLSLGQWLEFRSQLVMALSLGGSLSLGSSRFSLTRWLSHSRWLEIAGDGFWELGI